MFDGNQGYNYTVVCYTSDIVCCHGHRQSQYRETSERVENYMEAMKIR